MNEYRFLFTSLVTNKKFITRLKMGGKIATIVDLKDTVNFIRIID